MRSWWWAALSFGAGIIIGGLLTDQILLGLILLLLLGCLSFWLKLRKEIIIYLFILFLGFFNACIRLDDVPEGLSNLPVQNLNGYVQNINSESDRVTFTLVNDEALWLLKKIRVSAYFSASLKNGDWVQIEGAPELPKGPRNPREFDYPVYLARQGIFYTVGLARSEQLISVLPSKPGMIEYLHNEIKQSLPEVVMPEAAPVILGMVLGDKESMPEEEYTRFQAVGIVHLLAVSGYHVGVLLAAVYFLLGLLKTGKRARLTVCLAVLLFYGTLTGWPISVQRAVLMAVLGLIAVYYGRVKSMLDVLGLAGVVILLVDPASLMSISFQLSFLATWGLIFLYPILRKSVNVSGKWIDLLLIPVAAQLATWPVVVYHFSLFSPISLLANILVVYLAAVVIVLGLPGLLLLPFMPVLASFILFPAELAAQLLSEITRWLYLIPGGYVWLKAPYIWMVVAYYGLLSSCFWLLANPQKRMQHHRIFLTGIGLSFIFFFIWLYLPHDYFNRELTLTFIDVGQGDSLLIKTPQGRYALIDGGGNEFYPVGERILLPYLRREGIRHLDWIFSTHPDLDHWQGLASVVQELPVRYFGVPQTLWNHEIYVAARKENTAVNWFGLQAGQSFKLDEMVDVRIWYPQAGTSEADVNEASLVLTLKYNNFSAWLGGDIGKPGLARLMQGQVLQPVTLFKIPHHGSKNSLVPGLYQALQPTYAVVQAGVDNRFGHPHPDVLAELEQQKIKIFNSQVSGWIKFHTDGFLGWFETYLPSS